MVEEFLRFTHGKVRPSSDLMQFFFALNGKGEATQKEGIFLK